MNRLLDFKVNSTSLRLFDGVDYNEEKKKREEELFDLMMCEMTNVNRRVKKTEGNENKEETKEETKVVRRAIKLPSMSSFQVLHIQSISSLVL